MAIYGEFESLYSKDSLDWFVKNFNIKNYDELKSHLSQPLYWTIFQQHRYSTGEISRDELHQILIDSGFTYSNGSYHYDNRSKFGSWVMDKFGPTFAKVCASLFGGAVLSDVLSSSSGSSDSSDTTPAMYGGTGFNPQTVVGSGQTLSPDNTFSWLSNFFGNLFGEKGSFTSMLTGLGSQFASSLLNKQNMIDLIDYQNQYNTPVAQMQRFKDAGLNPNLVYGLGSNGNQPSAGSVAPVDFDTSQRENRMAMMQFDLASKQAQADIAQKMSAVQLNNANASEVEERRIAQANQNSIFEVYKMQAINDLNIKAEQLRSAKANATSDEARAFYADELAYTETQIAKLTESNLSEENKILSSESEIIGNKRDTYWVDYLFDLLFRGLGSFRGSISYGDTHNIYNNDQRGDRKTTVINNPH